MGVTGARASVGAAAAVSSSAPRRLTDLPVCVGLGVSTGAQAAEVAAFADGVIVGSALVACLTGGRRPRGRPDASLRALVAPSSAEDVRASLT